MSALYAALKIYYFLPILSGLIGISVYSCGELRKASSERKIDMKKLVIILTIAIMLFATLKQHTEQPATVAVGASQNTTTGQPEELLESHTEQVERITEPSCEPVPTEATEKETAVQSPMKEYAEETETQKATEPEKQ